MRKRIGIIGVLLVSGMLVLLGLSPSAIADGQSVDDGGNSDGEEISIGTTSDDYDVFFIRNDVEMMRLDDGVVVFNENSGNIDFRIEGDNDANLFFGDAGNDRIGIGTSTPDAKLDVETSSGGAAEIGHTGNSATGDHAVAMGYFATASGDYSLASGWTTTASGDYSTALGGYSTVASGDGSFAVGYGCTASGLMSRAIGGFNAEATATYSCAIGSFVTASNVDSYVIGRGYGGGSHLVNNIESSLMVGFDSTTPTLFVDGSGVGIDDTSLTYKLEVNGEAQFDGALRARDSTGIGFRDDSGTLGVWVEDGGQVGIGITDPQEKLEIDGNIRFNSGTARTIYVEDLTRNAPGDDLTIRAGNAYEFGGIQGFAGGDLILYAGDGAGPIGARSGDVYMYGGTLSGGADGDVHLAYTGSASRGNVGIGTQEVAAKLHVDQSSTTGALPVLTVDQADVSEEFIRFIGTSADGVLTQSIVEDADVTTSTPQGWLKIYVQDDGNELTDQAYFVPIFTLA
jgi:hypothetical protein